MYYIKPYLIQKIQQQQQQQKNTIYHLDLVS